MEPRIALKPSMAAAIAQDASELRTLLTLFNSRSAAHKRMTDAILTDEGFSPEEFDSYQLKTERDQTYLVPMRSQQQPGAFLPASPPPAEPPAAAANGKA